VKKRNIEEEVLMSAIDSAEKITGRRSAFEQTIEKSAAGLSINYS
jgi:hypothetical protein